MRKIYGCILAVLLAIAALGVSEMIKAAAAYRDRPMVEERAKPIESKSANPTHSMEGDYA